MSTANSRSREVILARRALFVATAINGLVTPHGAGAEEPPGEPAPQPAAQPAVEPSASDQEQVRRLFTEAMAAKDAGDFATAERLLAQAAQVAPHRTILRELVMVRVELGAWVEARKALAQLRSTYTHEDVPPELVELERESAAHVAVLRFDASPEVLGWAQVLLDEQAIEAERVRAEVAPGRHRLRFVRGAQSIAIDIDAGAGAEVEVHVPPPGPEVVPMPCLSPCLAPPHYGVDREGLSFGASLGPAIFISVHGADNYFGGALMPMLVIGATENVDVRLGAYLAPTGSAPGLLLSLGGWTSARVGFDDNPFAAGLGVTAGYAFAPDPLVGFEEHTPASSFFITPEIVPLALRMSRLEAELRVGLTFMDRRVGGETELGPTFVHTGLWVSYVLYDEGVEYWVSEAGSDLDRRAAPSPRSHAGSPPRRLEGLAQTLPPARRRGPPPNIGALPRRLRAGAPAPLAFLA